MIIVLVGGGGQIVGLCSSNYQAILMHVEISTVETSMFKSPLFGDFQQPLEIEQFHNFSNDCQQHWEKPTLK